MVIGGTFPIKWYNRIIIYSPLTQKLMNIPARLEFCDHILCFELIDYLKFN